MYTERIKSGLFRWQLRVGRRAVFVSLKQIYKIFVRGLTLMLLSEKEFVPIGVG